MVDLTNIATIRRIMHEYKTFAQKKLGQHFLIDQDTLSAIIDAAELKPNDTVLEIGPGLGTLTKALSVCASKIIAVEKDMDMIKIFQAINSNLTNVQIVRGNILMLNNSFFKEYLPKSYKVVANLPYYLTSAILRFFLQSSHRPAMMVLMVQKEVGERIIATSPNANVLGLAVQFYGIPEIMAKVPNTHFWPIPKVDSAILRITSHSKARYHVDNEDELFKVIKAGFGEKRKKLHNSLTGGLKLPHDIVKKILVQSKIDIDRRAQTLTIPEWIRLYQNLKKL